MPVTTLQATANGSDTIWVANSGTRWEAVLPPDDADTTYVYLDAASSNSRISFAFQNLDGAARGIQTHTLTRRCRKVSGTTSNVKGSLLLSGTYVNGASVVFGASYSNESDVDLAKPGGGTWQPADINASEAGLVRGGGGADEDRCTTLKWAVTWQPDTGNFASFAASLIGLVGGGLLLRHMPLLAAAISAASLRRVTGGVPGPHVRVLESEYLSLWRELRCHPYRRYVWA